MSANLCNLTRERLPNRISSVAGVRTPAFVERTTTTTPTRSSGCVAGVRTPAFAARTCRPWCVAGVRTPAFVERRAATLPWSSVSASLSEPRLRCARGCGRVSPGFEPRPSLSDGQRYQHRCNAALGGRVAGVRTPAFVERTRNGGRSRASVAGVRTPAFVEAPARPRRLHRVSPGFEPRPSLSDESVLGVVCTCVAGVRLVERMAARIAVGRTPCRRGSNPGLR